MTEMSHSAVLTTCLFGTSQVFFNSADSLVSDDIARVTDGLILAPRLHPQLSSEHVILYTLNGDAIFFRVHPYIWSTTVLHDRI